MKAHDGVSAFDFSSIPGFIHWLAQPDRSENLDPSVRLRRILLVTLALLMSLGGILWGTIALSVGAVLQSTIPYGYVLATVLNLSLFRLHRHFFVTSQVQLGLSLLLPFLFQWSLGGGRASGAMMLWSILALVGALLVRTGRAFYWILSFVLLAGLSLALEPYVESRFTLLNANQQVFALTLNVCIIMVIVFGLMQYFVRKLDYSEHLENLVSERTRDLRVQLETTKSLLNGMKQAVFAIDQSGIVVPPVSAAARRVLGVPIENRHLVEAVLERAPEMAGQRSSYDEMIQSVFCFDQDQWNTVEEQLPKKLQLPKNQQWEEQSLRLNYSPLWDEQGALSKVIFVAEDITEVLRLERQVTLEKTEADRQARVIQDIAGNTVNELRNFFKKVGIALRELKGSPVSLPTSQKGFHSEVQLLHRLKGEAQLMKLNLLAQELHLLEDFFLELKDLHGGSQAGESPLNELSTRKVKELEKFESTVATYHRVAARLLNLSLSSDADSPSTIRLEAPLESYKKIKHLIQSSRRDGGMIDSLSVEALLDEITGQPLEAALERLETVIEEMAERSDKKVRFTLTAENIKVSPLLVGTINEILLHLVRNAVDHGIESPNERIRKGKNPVGKVRISATRKSDMLSLSIKDDGQGIASEKLVQKAIVRGLLSLGQADELSHQQKLDLIFVKALSTREHATEYSGRGMGMDIVRDRVQDCAGSIALTSVENEGTEFIIQIPGA